MYMKLHALQECFQLRDRGCASFKGREKYIKEWQFQKKRKTKRKKRKRLNKFKKQILSMRKK